MLDELPKVKTGHVAIAGRQAMLLYTDGLVERRHGEDIVSDDAVIRHELAASHHAQALIDTIAQRLQREQDTQQFVPFDDISAVALYFDNPAADVPHDA